MKKKLTKPKQIKKLEKRAGELWREICFLRDGRMCQVQKDYPNIDIYHAGYLQVDHCITRGNKHFFFDPRNGTIVCGTCNRAKCYKQKSIDRAIDEIVRKREGDEWFDEAVRVDQSMAPNMKWKKIWWLEEIIEGLEKTLKEMEKR